MIRNNFINKDIGSQWVASTGKVLSPWLQLTELIILYTPVIRNNFINKDIGSQSVASTGRVLSPWLQQTQLIILYTPVINM